MLTMRKICVMLAKISCHDLLVGNQLDRFLSSTNNAKIVQDFVCFKWLGVVLHLP